MYIFIEVFKNTKNIKKTAIFLFSQIVFSLVVFFCILLFLNKNFDLNNLFNSGILNNKKVFQINYFYYLMYFFVPIFFTVIIYFIRKIDLYEILLKFTPIYIMMFVEFLLISSSIFFGYSFDVSMIENRIPLIFLHYYYYVPFIYLVTRPKVINYTIGLESKIILKKIDQIFSFIFNSCSKIFLPIIIIILYIFFIQSFLFNYQLFKNENVIEHHKLIDKYKSINSFLKNEDIILYDDMVLNIYSMIDFEHSRKQILRSKFHYPNHSEDIMQRIVLISKIFNWEIESLYNFLLPGKLQNTLGQNIKFNNLDIFYSGIGYWLINDNYQMSLNEINDYKDKIKLIYDKINVENAIMELNITHIYSKSKLNLNISDQFIILVNDGYIYKFNNSIK